MEGAFLAGDKVRRACETIVQSTRDRHSVLVFCAGVDHAYQVASELEKLLGDTDSVRVITGESPPLERQSAIERFRERRLKFLVNVDVLTTGFDAPSIDTIAVLRATLSAGLFAQIVGRGLRVDASKGDCLILDFGENIYRHGPIDSPEYGARKEKSAGGEENGNKNNGGLKLCPACREEVGARTATCECGWQFPVKHEAEADKESNILTEPEEWRIEEIELWRHKGKIAVVRSAGRIVGEYGKPDTLRVDYFCHRVGEDGNLPEKISEWVCLEHTGWARRKALSWWREHSISDYPRDIDEAIDLWEMGALRMPCKITTQRDGFWNRILSREFETERPTEWSDEIVDVFDDAPF
jgi:DNA repair protein RadD